MTPREFFPRMPDEAFDVWLAPLVAQVGWPFSEIGDPLTGRWQHFLSNIPLNRWHAFTWQLREIELTQKAIAFSSLMLCDDIRNHCASGAQTMTANLENTKERFRAPTNRAACQPAKSAAQP